jgi:hypothetical protein
VSHSTPVVDGRPTEWLNSDSGVLLLIILSWVDQWSTDGRYDSTHFLLADSPFSSYGSQLDMNDQTV